MPKYTPAIGSPTHRRLIGDILQRNAANVAMLKRLHTGASGPAKDILFDLVTAAHADQQDLQEMLFIIKYGNDPDGPE